VLEDRRVSHCRSRAVSKLAKRPEKALPAVGCCCVRFESVEVQRSILTPSLLRVTHGGVSIEINAQVPYGGGWSNPVVTNPHHCLGDLMLSSACRTPEHFRFPSVELESIAPHPQGDVVNTRRHLLLKGQSTGRWAKTINLRIVGVTMWMQVVTLNQSEQVGLCTAGKESVRGPIPVELQIKPRLELTLTCHSGRSDYDRWGTNGANSARSHLGRRRSYISIYPYVYSLKLAHSLQYLFCAFLACIDLRSKILYVKI